MDAREVTVANGNGVADAEPAGEGKPNTYGMRFQILGDIDRFSRDAYFICFPAKCNAEQPRNYIYIKKDGQDENS